MMCHRIESHEFYAVLIVCPLLKSSLRPYQLGPQEHIVDLARSRVRQPPLARASMARSLARSITVTQSRASFALVALISRQRAFKARAKRQK